MIARTVVALPLLLPLSPQPNSSRYEPPAQVLPLVNLQFVTPRARPDFDKEVLAPLRVAQAKRAAEEKARLEALAAAEAVRVAQEQAAAVQAAQTSPAPSYAAPDAIRAIIVAAASHGMSVDTMLRIAKCESGYNPLARNPNYTVPGFGNPVGLFQHIEGYWPARAARYGYPGASVFDPVANANVTAAMMAAEGVGAWECK